MYEFKLPDLGEGIHEAEVLKWHVQPGDAVGEDEPLVDVETDKATVTIPSPAAGKFLKANGEVGDTVHVGDIIAVIGAEGESVADEAPPKAGGADRKEAQSEGEAKSEAAPPEAATGVSAAPRTPGEGPVPAAPATRRLAREQGVDINGVPGTGPAGRVTPEDVRRYASGETAGTPATAAHATAAEAKSDRVESEEATRKAPDGALGEVGVSGLPFVDLEPMPDFERWGEVEREPVRSIRRKIARKMATAGILVPQVTHTDEVDITKLEEFRAKIKARSAQSQQDGGSGKTSVTVLAFVTKAVVAALKGFPMFNASLDPYKEELVLKRYYNIGIAADSPKGLVVPVLKDVDRKSLLEVAQGIRELGKRARDGELRVDDFQGGTFTISNIGALGGFSPNPIVNYPEVAVLGMGAMKEEPVVRGGQVEIRKMLPLGVSFDHRVADGADAARFLNELTRRLEDPEVLLLES